MPRKVVKAILSFIILLSISCFNPDKNANDMDFTRRQDSIIIDSLSIELSDIFAPQTSVSRQYQKQLLELLGPVAFREAKNNKNWQSVRYNEEYIWVLFYDKKQIIYGRHFTIVLLKLSSNTFSVALVDSLSKPQYYGEDTVIPQKLRIEVKNLINQKL